MFGSTILEVAIGLILVFLLTSLVVSATNELIAAFFRSSRAKYLTIAIQQMLNPELATKLFEHPLIQGMAAKGSRPSYIPSRTFVQALLSQMAPGEQTVAGVVAAAEGQGLGRVFQCLAEEAKGDYDNLKISVEFWFNRSMDRISGVYKRKTQWVTLGLGLLVAVLFNVDVIQLAATLWNEPATRSAMMAAAEKVSQPKAAGDLRSQVDQFRSLPGPIGWSAPASEQGLAQADVFSSLHSPFSALFWKSVVHHMLGWVVTAIAASLGAPFWFDTLSKFMNVRAAGRAPEEEPHLPRELPLPQLPGGP